MIALTTATLECEVCGAGWQASGEILSNFLWPFDALGEVFFADEPPECPECGEADMWDIAKPERVA